MPGCRRSPVPSSLVMANLSSIIEELTEDIAGAGGSPGRSGGGGSGDACRRKKLDRNRSNRLGNFWCACSDKNCKNDTGRLLSIYKINSKNPDAADTSTSDYKPWTIDSKNNPSPVKKGSPKANSQQNDQEQQDQQQDHQKDQKKLHEQKNQQEKPIYAYLKKDLTAEDDRESSEKAGRIELETIGTVLQNMQEHVSHMSEKVEGGKGGSESQTKEHVYKLKRHLQELGNMMSCIEAGKPLRFKLRMLGKFGKIDRTCPHTGRHLLQSRNPLSDLKTRYEQSLLVTPEDFSWPFVHLISSNKLFNVNDPPDCK